MRRVIVADDDRVTSHLLCAILRQRGFAPEAAMDVPSLADACGRSPAPFAILLDLHMPGGSAADAIRAIQRDPALAEVPIIIVSGSDDAAELAEARALGAGAALRKPVSPQALLAALERYT